MKTTHAILISLIIFTVCTSTDCNRGRTYLPPPAFQFREKINVAPYRRTFAVNDTIWLSINIPGKKIFDSLTNTRVFFDSANMRLSTVLDLVYNNPLVLSTGLAEVIFPTGVSGTYNEYNGKTVATASFGCASGATDYKLKLAYVLKRKGVYVLSFATVYDHGDRIFKCDNADARASIQYTYDVPDAFPAFYAALPFDSVGQKKDENLLAGLKAKIGIVVEVK